MLVTPAVFTCAGKTPQYSSIVRDMYQGVRAAQVLSTLVLIMAIAPIAGPLLGGFLVVSGGWRLTFWAIVTISAIILILVFFLPESLPERVFGFYGGKGLINHPSPNS